jgi:hypothetical protein
MDGTTVVSYQDVVALSHGSGHRGRWLGGLRPVGFARTLDRPLHDQRPDEVHTFAGGTMALRWNVSAGIPTPCVVIVKAQSRRRHS